MSGLVDKHGRSIKSSDLVNKKAAPPKMGEAFGNWAGRDTQFLTMPGGGVVQFDLSKLQLSDFRSMKDHYQVNASLAVLSFMQHQSDWHLVGPDQKINDHCEENLRNIWTPLNRAMSQSNWAGFSPNALNWENDVNSRTVVINKVKDLLPEECTVKWDQVEGYAPPGRPRPKYNIYGGIRQVGSPYPIPVENSFWYPMLMENGDYYGKKLLRPAFTSWFFSILVHLFANRYYERFGEPVPIGRAPFEDDITLPDGRTMAGNVYMLEVLQQLRNRSVVVLPNERTQGDNGKQSFDYELEYLESQMRGADFERYMTRLDEEISIGLFTPILLMRTADVGSYNLGVGHMQMYLWMLNAMNDDRAVYINKYLLRKMTDYNFSPNAPAPHIVFRKLGNQNQELVTAIMMEYTRQGRLAVDLKEIGQITGMTLKEVDITLDKKSPEGDKSEADGKGSGTGKRRGESAKPSSLLGDDIANTVKQMVERVRRQVTNAESNGYVPMNMKISMGYKNKMCMALGQGNTNNLFNFMDRFVEDMLTTNLTVEQFMDDFEWALENRIGVLVAS